jgi:ATP-binding cassette subfamily B protein
VLRNQVFVLDHMYVSLLNTIGWIVRVVITVALLMTSTHCSSCSSSSQCRPCDQFGLAPAVERQVEEQFAQHNRLAEHLFATATSAAAPKRYG